MMRQLFCCLTAAALLFGQTPGAALHEQIRREATRNSKIFDTLHNFTDVYGGRLTGSPSLKAAGEWAVKRLTEWGLENAHLEPWNFGHPGWENERVAAHMLSPDKDTLVVEALGWTPSTKGRVRGAAFRLPYKTVRTQEEFDAWITPFKGKLKGKIVLTGNWTPVAVDFSPRPKRTSDEDVRRRYDPANPQAQGPPMRRPEAAKPEPGKGTPLKAPADQQIAAFLVAERAVVQVTNANMAHGLIRAFQNRTYDVKKALPTAVMRHEDFGRIQRLLEGGSAVELEVEIVNKVYPEGKTTYNVVAELPGSDKKDEVVMLGGHLDSWHGSTGATDNAVGAAVTMEALRILKVTGAKPRRTIRLGLWGGEEQGLLGSKAYVEQHFGSAEKPKPDWDKFIGYLNIDAGTGRARGMSVFGPAAAAEALRGILKPFADLGVFGASTSRSRALGGSDHTSFNQAGLAGIGVGQDPIEYFGLTWHTNVDSYERIVAEDVQKSAIVLAATAFELASREERLPRFSKADMPPPPAPPKPEAAKIPTDGGSR
jgi:hypothetical protein